MKAEIKSILPVKETYEWNEIQLEDNWNHYEWFTFDKESIINVLFEYISNISGSSWNQISEEISKVMEWEYEWIA